MSDSSSEYERGHTAARMSNYDKHFERLNGSMDDTAEALKGMREENQQLVLAVQQLRDQHKSDAETRVATAQALKDAAEAIRIQSEQRWSPKARLVTTLASLAGIIGVVVSIYFGVRA